LAQVFDDSWLALLEDIANYASADDTKDVVLYLCYVNVFTSCGFDLETRFVAVGGWLLGQQQIAALPAGVLQYLI
jgi:hypothetical protein